MTPKSLSRKLLGMTSEILSRPPHLRRYPIELKSAVGKLLRGGHPAEDVAAATGLPIATIRPWRGIGGTGHKSKSAFVPMTVESLVAPTAEDSGTGVDDAEDAETDADDTSDDEVASDDDQENIVIETRWGCRIFIPV